MAASAATLLAVAALHCAAACHSFGAAPALAAALASEAFIKQAEGAAPKKVIVVPGRLVNIVV